MKNPLRKFWQAIPVAFLLFSFPFSIQATPGDLDPTFDADGKLTADFSGLDDLSHELAIQSDGKIVVVGSVDGSTTDFALARFNPDGSLDNTFSVDGKVTTDIAAADDEAYAVAVQPDGKIVVAGQAFTGVNNDFALARYHLDGKLDLSFDVDGRVTTNFSGNDLAFGVVIQSDGKIVAVGRVNGGADFALARYNADGSLDTTFDVDGRVTTDFFGAADSASDVAIESGGRIVVAGSANGGTDSQFALARYNSDGSLDSNFDADGKVTTQFGPDADIASSIVIQPDGKILVAGYHSMGTSSAFALARYSPDGSLDLSFEGDGKVITDFIPGAIDFAEDIALQPDGKIVAAGLVILDFGVVRYNPDGTLDNTFSFDGKVATDFTGGADGAGAVGIQTDGKIVLAGAADTGASADFALARYIGDSVAVCVFCDDFEDGTLAANWDYQKPSWTESGGNLIGTPAGRKAQTIATPAFAGCNVCSVETSMATAGGAFNKLFFYAWFLDKKNTVVVLMKQENNKFVMKQVVGGITVRKTKGLATIIPNVFYNVRVTFDGTNFSLIVDGNTLATMAAAVSPIGTVGFAVKNTVGSFGFITVN